MISSVLHGVMSDAFTFSLCMQDPTILYKNNDEKENLLFVWSIV